MAANVRFGQKRPFKRNAQQKGRGLRRALLRTIRTADQTE